MMKIICLALFVALAAAGQNNQISSLSDAYPDGSDVCQKNGFKRIDLSQYYQDDAILPNGKAICVRNFMTACFTVDGAQACNPAYAACVSTTDEWWNQWLNPKSAARMKVQPQVCASEGAYWNMETAIIAVVVPVVAFAVGVVGLVLLYQAGVGSKVPITVQILAIANFVVCTLLLFSYYYLNAFLGYLVSFVILGFVAKGDKNGIAGAIVVLVGVLFWLTFKSGLGFIQHHNRLIDTTSTASVPRLSLPQQRPTTLTETLTIQVQAPAAVRAPKRVPRTKTETLTLTDTDIPLLPSLPAVCSYTTMQECICNNYYRGFMGWPELMHGPFESPNVITTRYCLREWLAAELFFIILEEIFITLLIACASANIAQGSQPSNQPEEAPAQPADTTTAPAA